jgi:hypothetical protein
MIKIVLKNEENNGLREAKIILKKGKKRLIVRKML